MYYYSLNLSFLVQLRNLRYYFLEFSLHLYYVKGPRSILQVDLNIWLANIAFVIKDVIVAAKKTVIL